MTNCGVDPLSCVGMYWLDDSLITHLPTTSVFVWLQPIRNSRQVRRARTVLPSAQATKRRLTSVSCPSGVVSAVLITPGGLDVKRAAISARLGDNLQSNIRLCQWGDL